MHPEI